MMILIMFAFLSGVITILSPCILPLLPVVLAGNVAGGRTRPYGVVTGFAVSFTGFTLGLSALVAATGISPDALRVAAVVILLLFGVVLIVPALKDRFQLLLSRLVARSSVGAKPAPHAGATDAASPRAGGYGSGLLVGVSLGLVWTPCVGPIMASVISLAVSHSVNAGSVFITLAYSLGTAIPMFAIMVGGRALLRRVPWLTARSAQIQRIFGVLMVAVAVVVAFGWDRTIETSILTAAPGYGAGLTSIENTKPVRKAIAMRDASAGAGGALATNAVAAGAGGAGSAALPNYGPAPALVADGNWFNSPPLTMKDLRGKVVLVDFWTYSCINCIRTLPYLRSWYQKYKSDGFVILGIHSPEFAFEHNPANVAKAIKELDVTWPVVQDNDFREWNAYKNMYWPADYFIDAKGDLRYYHFGEGDYTKGEAVIRELLTEAGHPPTAPATEAVAQVGFAGTPETYLGSARAAGFAGSPGIDSGDAIQFTAPKSIGPNEWDLSGRWKVRDQYIAPVGTGTLRLSFDAKQVYLVIQVPGSSTDPGGGAQGGSARMTGSKASTEASDPPRLTVTVDGKTGLDTADLHDGILRPSESRMYHVVTLPKEGRHLLTIKAEGDVRLFSFTFGG